jgi:NADH:ubiquinone oxidoreductase subunit 6 (subunit J)
MLKLISTTASDTSLTHVKPKTKVKHRHVKKLAAQSTKPPTPITMVQSFIMTLYTTMICVCSLMSSPDCKRKKLADDVSSVAKMSNVSLHLFQFFTYSFPIYNLVLLPALLSGS